MTQHQFIKRVGLVALAAIVVGLIWQSIPLMQASLFSWSAKPRIVTPRGDLAEDEKSTIALFENAKGSVVFIATAERVFDPFTRNAIETPRGTGSGFVWDELGHVVTNNHVIAGASQAVVRLADGRSYRASLVGTDPAHDLAVVLIGVGLDRPRPLAIGTSQDLKVGQKVFAIGNPFGLDWTLTTGIVSALERELPTDDNSVIRGLIQTDAPINPGNSGGPLIDSAGRLIGVNTAIYSPSGASAGIGFAVPVDTVNRVVPQLIAKGRYTPPSLGVAIDPSTEALLTRARLKGVAILGVNKGSSAERVGLRPARLTRDGELVLGDLIVGLDGKEIGSVADLRAALDARRPGDTVKLGILREGRRAEVEITLGAGSL
jgi:S1-C subfamily serine protease